MKRQVPDELKRASLEKVLESLAFARAEQMRRLLCWLVDRALESGTPPTEYEVGRLALRRPETFDPQTDSLVRKEMNRLRSKLRLYYAVEGSEDLVRLRSEDGYRISFEWAHPQTVPAAAGNHHRSVLVLPPNAGNGATELAENFYEELLIQLAAADHLHLISQTTARMYAQSFGDVREVAMKTGAEFVVEGTLRTRDDSAQVTLWLVDGTTGIAHQLSRLTGGDVTKLAGEAAEKLVERLHKGQ